MKKVLIIEDDKDIMELVAIHLGELNCEVARCYNGNDGFRESQSAQYDLMCWI